MRGVLAGVSCVLCLVTCALSYAQQASEQQPEIRAEVSEHEISIGDHLKLDLVAYNSTVGDVTFLEEPQELGEFVLISSEPLEKAEGREYVVSIYTTGTHVIPAIPVKYRSASGDSWNIIWSPQVSIEVKSILTGKEKDIRDLKGIIVFWYDPMFPVYVLLGMLIAGIVLYLLWRRKKRIEALLNEEELLSPDERAYRLLSRLKAEDLPSKGMIKEYYTKLSDIVRHYLEERFSFRAPEMTTEEFMEFVKRSPELLREHKELLKDFLSHCDMVKFAKYGPTPLEMIDSYSSAEKLIDQTKEIKIEEEESKDE